MSEDEDEFEMSVDAVKVSEEVDILQVSEVEMEHWLGLR